MPALQLYACNRHRELVSDREDRSYLIARSANQPMLVYSRGPKQSPSTYSPRVYHVRKYPVDHFKIRGSTHETFPSATGH
jgi:hypothetical protein